MTQNPERSSEAYEKGEKFLKDMVESNIKKYNFKLNDLLEKYKPLIDYVESMDYESLKKFKADIFTQKIFTLLLEINKIQIDFKYWPEIERTILYGPELKFTDEFIDIMSKSSFWNLSANVLQERMKYLEQYKEGCARSTDYSTEASAVVDKPVHKPIDIADNAFRLFLARIERQPYYSHSLEGQKFQDAVRDYGTAEQKNALMEKKRSILNIEEEQTNFFIPKKEPSKKIDPVNKQLSNMIQNDTVLPQSNIEKK